RTPPCPRSAPAQPWPESPCRGSSPSRPGRAHPTGPIICPICPRGKPDEGTRVAYASQTRHEWLRRAGGHAPCRLYPAPAFGCATLTASLPASAHACCAGEEAGVPIQRVGVVGCGLMGSGIAETCARSGYDTLVREVNDELLRGGLERLEQSMGTAVSRGKLSAEEAETSRRRLRGTTSLEDLVDRD